VAPILNPNNRLSIYGVSVLPPTDGEWTLVHFSGYQLSMVRSGDRKDESLVTSLSLFELPEFSSNEKFLSHVSEGRTNEPDIGRFKLISNNEVLESLSGVNCVRYHSSSEDKHAQVTEGKTAAMILKNFGFICQHPLNVKVGVSMEYSLRKFSESTYPDFVENANFYALTVKFENF
jgi:hypothetical protein